METFIICGTIVIIGVIIGGCVETWIEHKYKGDK